MGWGGRSGRERGQNENGGKEETHLFDVEPCPNIHEHRLRRSELTGNVQGRREGH